MMNLTENQAVETYSTAVQSGWIDYNGHMSEAYYVLVFGYATDSFYELIGAGADYRNTHHCSIYTLEAHINYLQEVSEGEPLQVVTQLLDADQKRMCLFHSLYNKKSGELLATTELMLLYVDMQTHRSARFPERLNDRIHALKSQHSKFPTPQTAGGSISLKQG